MEAGSRDASIRAEAGSGSAASIDTIADDPGSTQIGQALPRGAELGRYVVLERLGAGGMGAVYAAYDPKLDRKVAVKVLLAGDDARAQQRLVREAQALARLNHTNVVAVHDVGTVGDRVFVAMEHVEGRTLGEWATHIEDWKRRLRACVDAGRGLAAAHAAGLVHRDVKPDNIIVGDDGRVRVLDFGLVRGEEEATAPGSEAADTTDVGEAPASISLTRTGAVLGTPAYMSPEQHLGVPAEAKADQFSLCVTTWELLYGQRPFVGKTLAKVALAVTSGSIADPPGDSPVPAGIQRALRRGLEADPDHRWPSMDALLTALVPAAKSASTPMALLGSAALVGGIAIAALVPDRDPAAVCEGLDAPLSAVWHGDGRNATLSAFDRSTLPMASVARDPTVAALDAWTRGWSEQRRDACEDTQIRHEQSGDLLDRRIACLDRALGSFTATVEVLQTGSDEALRNAQRTVTDLPSLSRCADTNALLAAVAPPPENTRAAVESAWSEVDRVAAYTKAGNYERSLELGQAVSNTIGTLAYEPLTAWFELSMGRLRDKRGEYDAAETAYGDAMLAATRGGDDELLTRALAELAVAAGVRRRDVAEGNRWWELASAAAIRAHADTSLRARVVNAGARVLMSGERHTDAIALLEPALEDLRADPDASPLQIAVLEYALGMARVSNGERVEAAKNFQRTLAIEREVLGADHPEAINTLGQIGATLRKQGDLDQAESHLREGLAALERALGPDHPDVAVMLQNLGNVLTDRGEYDEALAIFTRNRAILVRVHGEGHPEVAESDNSLAILLKRKGDLPGAETRYRAALEVWRARLGPDHPDVALVLVNLGILDIAREQYPSAKANMAEAYRIFRAAHGDEHPYTRHALEGLGQAEAWLGETEAAIGHIEESIRVLTAMVERGDSDPGMLGASNFSLAEILAESTDPVRLDRARTLAEEARDLFAKSTGHQEWDDHAANVEPFLATLTAKGH